MPGLWRGAAEVGFGRSREVRMLHNTRVLTPRRAICSACARKHVLRPAWALPRRRDAAAVIGQALALAIDGDGHRVIASTATCSAPADH